MMARQNGNIEGARYVKGARAVCAAALTLLLAFPVPTASLAWAAESLGAGNDEGAASAENAGSASAALGQGGSADARGADSLSAAGVAEGEEGYSNPDAVDITEQWRAGSLTLDAAGTYVLTDDITAGGTLYFSAPAGQAITLDFNGHVATVDDAAHAIDVARSYGAAAIVNSAPQYRDEQSDHVADNLKACLVLKADDMTEAVYGISYETPDASADEVARAEAALAESLQGERALEATSAAGNAAEGLAHVADSAAFSLALENVAVEVSATARTREALGYDVVAMFADVQGDRAQAQVTPRLSVRNCALRAVVTPELDEAHAVADRAAAAREAGGVTCALFVGAGMVHLDGSLSAQATGAGEAWDLLSVEKDAFVMEEGFEACEDLSVSEGGAVEGIAALATNEGDGALAGAADAAAGEGIAAQAADTDLNAAWKAAGFSSSYTITQGGRYYLSADLTTSTTLEINAPDAEVTLDLNGHTLTIQSLSAQGYGVNIKAAKKVTITGNSATASKLFFNSAAITYAISSAADELVVSGVTVQSRSHDDYLTLKDLFATSVYATRGTLSVSNCRLIVDLSNQGNATVSSNNATTRGPVAVYVGANVADARVENTTMEVTNSPVVSVRNASDIAGVGYAYGLYSLTSADVAVSGCAFDVTSALGSAVGACGKKLTFSGTTKMTLTAASQALGINSQSANAVKLDGSLAVTYGSNATDVRAALYSLKANAFTLGSGFSGSGLGAWIESGGAVNDNAVRIASFDASVDAGAKTRLAGMLSNAQGSSGACAVAADDAGAYFALQASRAPVKVTHGGADVLYASFSSAVAAAQPGDTITLLTDADDLSINKVGTAALAFTVDLNGHSVKSFANNSSARVDLISSAVGGQVSGRSDSTGAAITYSGSSAMTIRDIEVNCVSSTLKTCGVLASGTGALTLENVDVVSTSERTEARGINQTNSSGGAITMTGGSISAMTTAMGVAAYGVTSSSTKGKLTVEQCPIDVRGTSATVSGVDVKASLAIAGSEGATSVHIYVGGESANAWGVRVASNTARVTLKDASVVVETAAGQAGGSSSAGGSSAASAQTAQTAQYWCLTSATSTSDFSPTWELDGSCLLESDTNTEICHSRKALSLGASFTSRSSSVAVASKNLSSATFASVAQSSASAQALAGVFVPAAGCAYTGWSTSVQGLGEATSSLAWSHADVMKNATTNVGYASVAEALAQTNDGDTLQLLSSCTTYEALTIGKNITLDLAGKTLSVNVAKASSAEATAVKVSAEDTVAIKGGTLMLTLGRNPETATTARTPYRGIEVAGGGALSVSSCTVNVTYAGASTTKPEVTLYGIDVSSGSLSLDGATRLTAQAASFAGGFGAQTVVGIYVSSTEAQDALNVAASATVRAENNAQALTQGAIGYPEGNVTGTNAENNADLIELDVEEGSDLDQEIQEQFLVKAKFDSKGDSDGYVFGAQVYYASSMELPSGLVVWTCSDRIDSADEGKLENIRATHVFVRSDYTIPADAFGIATASGFAGTADVAGAVSATTTKGRAYGIYRSEGGAWNIASAKAAATCGNEPYRANLGKLNLADYATVAEDAAKKEVVYPEDASYREVVTVKPVSQAVVTQKAEPKQLSLGAVAPDELYAATAGTVSVKFTNMKSASGAASADRAYAVTWGKTLAETGAQMPAASDYQIGDVTYRFVGWASAAASSGAGVYDPQTLREECAVDATMLGATDGEVVFVASYVPVLEGQHLVMFKVADLLHAYAVDDGTSPSFAGAYGAADTVVPSLTDSEISDGYTLTFKGWVAGRSDDLMVPEGAQVNAGVLPAAKADVTYTAAYKATAATTTVTFRYMRSSSAGASYVYSGDADQHFNWEKANGDAMPAANERVKVGDTFVQDGTTYTFLGWSKRQSDKEPLYTDVLPVTGQSDSGFSDKVTFYGIYETSEKVYTVLFNVGDEPYATASNVAASKTLSAAFAASDNPVDPVSAEEGVAFRGWNTDKDATSYLYANIKKLGEIATGDSDTIELYAIWRQASKPSAGDDPSGSNNPDTPATGDLVVTFYDSDRATVVDTLAVNLGETVFKSTGEDPKPRGENADLFMKWVDEDGNDFSVTQTPVSASMKVYAVYFQDNGGTGVLSGSGSGGSGGSDGMAPAGTTNAKLSGSASGGGLAASSGGGADADGEGASDAEADGEDGVVLEPSAVSSQASGAADGTAADEEAMPEAGEDASNVAGVVLVIVALLAVVGGAAWWFLRRRAVDAREAAEDEAEQKAQVAAASGQLAAESIRF